MPQASCSPMLDIQVTMLHIGAMRGVKSVGRGAARVMAIVVVALVAATEVRLAGQQPSAPVERIGDRPNLSGIWQAVNEAHWDLEAHEARPGPSQFGALFFGHAIDFIQSRDKIFLINSVLTDIRNILGTNNGL